MNKRFLKDFELYKIMLAVRLYSPLLNSIHTVIKMHASCKEQINAPTFTLSEIWEKG
jgi:hypothetical protein